MFPVWSASLGLSANEESLQKGGCQFSLSFAMTACGMISYKGGTLDAMSETEWKAGILKEAEATLILFFDVRYT